MLRPIFVAAATFLAATPALAASDVRVQIPAPAPVHVYEATQYAIQVSNLGNANANNVALTIALPQTHTSPTVHVMGDLGNIDSRCTQSGTTLVCNLGRIRRNKSTTVAFDIELPQSATPLQVTATATTSSTENTLANNAATDTPSLLNFDVAVADGDVAHIEHCTGQNLTSFFECLLYPSSLMSHEVEFHGGGSLTFPGVPGSYTGIWSQPAPDRLDMTYFDGGMQVADFEGYGTSPGCFEGLTTFGGSYVSLYEVCL